MPHLYLDLFSGISGDMFLGALVDLGVPFARLETELRRLPVDGYHLHTQRGQKCGISGIKFDVHLDHDHTHAHAHAHAHAHSHDHPHPHSHDHSHSHDHGHAEGPAHTHGRTFAEIRRIIAESGLGDWVKSRSIAVFHRIALAEGKIHGLPTEDVHFHEVGAVDSIVDVVGGTIALDLLGRPRVFASRVVEGTGFVRCDHGRMPLPAPATLEILAARQVAITQCEEPGELVTPTGAAILAEFAESFGPLPAFAARKVGYGLGTRDNRTRPNVLRAMLGESQERPQPSAHDWETDTIAVLEANIDDVSGEILGHFMGRALEEGALDVFHTPIQMKKNRPGVQVTILCALADGDRLGQLLLTETSAFGVRQTLASRRKLRREFRSVETAWGPVRVKLGRLDGRVIHATPEFDDCQAIARRASVSLREVFAA
ncbi:MAG: nickel pincer cofactor biosynthesis protein LarC, partial [Verrucomicrobiales bacterium]|nr:nickel pincer cofactor biosynthesis protein LarC [Verrucomicrobiales bacterium]